MIGHPLRARHHAQLDLNTYRVGVVGKAIGCSVVFSVSFGIPVCVAESLRQYCMVAKSRAPVSTGLHVGFDLDPILSLDFFI
jgi:hypothetical protein